jgi:hypothetical protein
MNQRPGEDGLARPEIGIGGIDPNASKIHCLDPSQCLTSKRESWKSLKRFPHSYLHDGYGDEYTPQPARYGVRILRARSLTTLPQRLARARRDFFRYPSRPKMEI